MGIPEVFDLIRLILEWCPLNPHKCTSGKSVMDFEHKTWGANSRLMPPHQLQSAFLRYNPFYIYYNHYFMFNFSFSA